VVLVLVAVAPAALGATTHNDDGCDIGNAPAATLLLPFFEVSMDGPVHHTTIFTLTNVTDTARVARVTLWTDYSYPVYTFNVYLTGYDLQTINLHDVLHGRNTNRRFGTGEWVSVHGERTQKNRELDDCGRIVDKIDPFQVDRMKIAFTEGVVPGCFSIGGDHENAIGYATVDVVGNCGSATPLEAEYFTEDIRFDNVLIGDYQQVGPEQDFAQGNPMVHIRAIGQLRNGRFVTNLPNTFYGRFQHPARPNADGRQPLPSTFAARWINGGQGGFETSFKIWRQGVTTAAAACKDYQFNGALALTESVVFDEDDNGVGAAKFECDFCNPPIGDGTIFLPSTSLKSIIDTDVFPQELIGTETAGWVYLNLRGDPARAPTPLQAWVVVSMRAEGRYSVDLDAASLGNGCSIAPVVTEFSKQGMMGVLPGPAPDLLP